MKIDKAANSSNKQAFGLNYSKLRTKANKRILHHEINKFTKKTNLEMFGKENSSENIKNSFLSASLLSLPIMAIIAKDSSLLTGGLDIAFSALFASKNYKIHQKALNNSAKLADKLKELGYQEKDIRRAIKRYLLKTGSPFQNLAYLFGSKDIKALAKGTENFK